MLRPACFTSAALVACVSATSFAPMAAATGASAPNEAEAAGDEANIIRLTGILRDFKVDHPDMQHPNKSFGKKQGVVENELNSEGKPVLKPEMARNAMITSEESFNQWFNDVPGVNLSVPHQIELTPLPSRPGVFHFARERGMPGSLEYFFPLDNHPGGWGDIDRGHNFYFTYEITSEFTFTDPAITGRPDMEFSFTGDDDVWVFINNRLAVDIGGVHAQEKDSINLDANMEMLGLEYGEDYEMKLFFAERHTSQSNFRIETTMSLRSDEPLERETLFD